MWGTGCTFAFRGSGARAVISMSDGTALDDVAARSVLC